MLVVGRLPSVYRCLATVTVAKWIKVAGKMRACGSRSAQDSSGGGGTTVVKYRGPFDTGRFYVAVYVTNLRVPVKQRRQQPGRGDVAVVDSEDFRGYNM